MQIRDLKLLNFRNYDKLSICFDKHLNIIYGPNGSGKTNLVESIYVLGLTRSFRQINDKNLIKKGTNLTKIEGLVDDQYLNEFKVIITNEGKKVKINKNKVTRLSEYISKIKIILFNPNDLKMIKDTPSIRRKYLNISISQIHIEYLKKLNAYNKVLKIRNNYLKKMFMNGNSLESYLLIITEKLIDIGLDLYKMRQKYIDSINKYIGDIYFKITKSGSLNINYKSDFINKTKEELLTLYKKSLKRDLNFGKTTYGIHHDDFEFLLDDMDLKEYGSEGQQKNAVISWKFSEISIFKSEKNSIPILILDDLLSELDLDKVKNILTFIQSDIQTFITTTEIEKLSSLLKNQSYRKFYVVDGILEEVK